MFNYKLLYELAMFPLYLGLPNISNVKSGDYYGLASEWGNDQRQEFGTFLLYRAFRIFLQEGETQIRPDDIKKK